jgi:hypothetical protein
MAGITYVETQRAPLLRGAGRLLGREAPLRAPATSVGTSNANSSGDLRGAALRFATAR